MAFLDRVARFETWPQLERAASHRFWDALILSVHAEHGGTGGIYLFGLSAEIYLKIMFYRLTDIPPGQDVGATRKKQLSGSGHELIDLVKALRSVNAKQSVAPEIIGVIETASLEISRNWNVALRYHDETPTHLELHEVFSAVERLMRFCFEYFSSIPVSG